MSSYEIVIHEDDPKLKDVIKTLAEWNQTPLMSMSKEDIIRFSVMDTCMFSSDYEASMKHFVDNYYWHRSENNHFVFKTYEA